MEKDRWVIKDMKFELNNLARDCSNEEIIVEIRRVDFLVKKDTLSKKDFDRYSNIHSSTLLRRFGDWRKVLELAGLAHKYSGRVVSEKQRAQRAKYMTNEEMLAELKDIAKKLNKNSVTVKDIENHSKILGPAVISHRFGSWPVALEKAGLKVSEKYHRKYSDEEYFENLLNVWAHYGRQPRWGEMKIVPSQIGPDGYVNRFGGWRKALQAFVKRMNQDEGDENRQVVKKEQFEHIVKKEIKQRNIPVEDRRKVPLALRFKVLVRDRYACVKCGAIPRLNPACGELEADHIIPFSRGGKTTLENLQTLCGRCNLGKGNRHSE